MPSAAPLAYSLYMRLFKRPESGAYAIEFERGHVKSLKAFVGHTVKEAVEARRVFNTVKAEYLAGKLSKLKGECSKTLREFGEEYLEWAEQAQKVGTFKANREGLMALLAYAGGSTKLDRLSQVHIDRLVADYRKRDRSTAQINKLIRHAKCVMNKAVEWGHIQTNPLRQVKQIRGERKLPAFMDGKQATLWLASIRDKDVRRLALAYLSTGVRRRELLALRWEHIDLERGVYRVTRIKTGVTELQSIHAMFRAVLVALEPKEEGFVITRWRHPDAVSHVIKQALKDGGYGHMSLHGLRHSFASQLAIAGESQKAIAELLGHSDPGITKVYVHMAQAHKKAALDKLKFGPVEV